MVTKKWDLFKDKNVMKLTLDNYGVAVSVEVEKAMRKLSLKSTRSAQQNAPTATGALRASLHPFFEKKGSMNARTLRAGVYSNKTYARTQEKGSGPRLVSRRNLEIWSRMKGANNPYAHSKAVQFTIRKRGVQPKTKGFMEKGLEKNKPWLEREIKKILGKSFK
jgi:hypothetical protein